MSQCIEKVGDRRYALWECWLYSKQIPHLRKTQLGVQLSFAHWGVGSSCELHIFEKESWDFNKLCIVDVELRVGSSWELCIFKNGVGSSHFHSPLFPNPCLLFPIPHPITSNSAPPLFPILHPAISNSAPCCFQFFTPLFPIPQLAVSNSAPHYFQFCAPTVSNSAPQFFQFCTLLFLIMCPIPLFHFKFHTLLFQILYRQFLFYHLLLQIPCFQKLNHTPWQLCQLLQTS